MSASASPDTPNTPGSAGGPVAPDPRQQRSPNAVAAAVRAGLYRGWLELKQSLSSTGDLIGYLLFPVVLLLVMSLTRNNLIAGGPFALGTMMVPSAVGLIVPYMALVSTANMLIFEREDGTLLRAKATPNGMLGYLVGKIVQTVGSMVVILALTLVPGAFLVDGLELGHLGSWFVFGAVLLLGIMATLPIGAVFGALFTDPMKSWLVGMPLLGLIGISGVFYPLSQFPALLQWIAQVFPVYWIGLGMRSAMLPAETASVEIDESWRHMETFGVLGAWAAFGLVLAPAILRRMARRESGAAVAARRQQAMQRAG